MRRLLAWLKRSDHRLYRWSEGLARSGFFEALNYLGRLTVLVGVVFYVAECDDRREARLLSAWIMVNAAEGKGSSGGRVEALQVLNSQGVSLARVNLKGAWLRGIQLPGADLQQAELSDAVVESSNLAQARLNYSVLHCADLGHSDLRNAQFHNAHLWEVNLSNSVLAGADLSVTNMNVANLATADLANANLERASLIKANLSGANLSGARLFRAALYYVSLKDTIGLTAGQLGESCLDETTEIPALVPPFDHASYRLHKDCPKRASPWLSGCNAKKDQERPPPAFL